MIGSYCVVRTYSAGVYCGIVSELAGRAGVLKDARMIYRWRGALSTLEISQTGVQDGSRLGVVVPMILLTEVIAVIPCSDRAERILREFKGE